ncbi:T9SS type A sorting domain-containing protein [Hyunsoonleella sp. SJ7]|uniref:T9SS type A sorting domain-containing protein n=1 Tax=Hyunsoonleella aquatilis TaxID=2762758 RepID=A0A923KIH7_9FLAO|nr:T9SS type A sorting domain-containing protein [Hyunsoonleella aquatilis]MBC3758574.1 T9SS type A sorting domain-containing protein [Hyunsoonleella aquatilis]
MKTHLLLPLFLGTFFSFSQGTDIEQFQSATASMYAVVESTPALDQSTAGADVTWSFNTLNKTGDSSDAHATPTAGEMTTFPGTTLVSTTTVVGGSVNKIYLKDSAGEASFTGLLAEGLELNYNSDNGLIGTFPLSYTDTNGTDAVAGSFNLSGSTPASGTFTGTITVEVDAYGTLNLNDVGAGAYNGQVTRLKIVQSLSLMAVTPLPITAAATQTSYFYYDASNADLVFRTARIEVPLLSVDETVMESLLSSTLSAKSSERDLNTMRIFPNPVKETLNFDLSSDVAIKAITVSDVTGRKVLSISTTSSTLNVNGLTAGIYIATLETSKGAVSRKFVKE